MTYGPPKEIVFDPNRQTLGMVKGSKAVAKLLKNKTKK